MEKPNPCNLAHSCNHMSDVDNIAVLGIPAAATATSTSSAATVPAAAAAAALAEEEEEEEMMSFTIAAL